MTNGDVLKTSKLEKDVEPDMEEVEAEGERVESPLRVRMTPVKATTIVDKRNL